MHGSDAGPRPQLRLVEPEPDDDDTHAHDTHDEPEAPALLTLMGADGASRMMALRSAVSPAKARAVDHYARLAAEARSARAD